MESKLGRIDDRTVPSPSPSSQSSSYSSDDQARRGNYSMVPDLLNNPRLLYTLQREIEKEIIRREIIAAEIERRRLPEEEASRELMIEREMAMHRAREMGLSIDDRLLMQLHTRYPWFPFSRNLGLGFGNDVLPSTLPHFSHGLWSGLDVNKKDELTMLGKPDSNICGSKQKAATPAAGSGELPSTSSNKPTKWSCALCQVSATTARGLYAHLEGKKHKANEKLLRDLKMFIISTSKKSTESRDSGGQEMKTKVQKESVKGNKTVVDLDQKVKGGLDGHSQRKKHKAKVARLLRGKKICGNFTSSVSKKSTESRGGAGQKMKTKAQEESVKANKTVVGLNQKVKGGLDGHPRHKKHKAKVARLLRDKKMCSNSTSSMSKKSKESRGVGGQKMKTKVQEESVKANKTFVGLNQNVKGGLDELPQGKKHKAKVARLRDKKMCSNSTSSTSKKSTESRGVAGKTRKTKVQEESVKATKSVVGLNQNVKGGLDERPQGKKHKAKVARLLRDKKMCTNSTSSTSKKSTESRGGAGQKMKTKVQEESAKATKTVVSLNQKVKGGLDEHLQGKQHKAKEEELLGAQKWTNKSTESRDIAGQEMKTKVEEKSIKANKTVVGSDQKGEGGQAQQVKCYPNLCGSKQEAATLPADSGKPCSTGSKKPMHWSCALCQVSSTSKRDLDEHLRGKKHKAKEEELLGAQKWTKKSTESRDITGQEIKTKVEEESVKANKTVVGSNQKGEGGQAQQVKPYPNLCGSNQEAATLPADSGKPCSTGSKKPMHWSCALCQVSSTSKRDLDEHLRGKKHKAKEEELLGAQKWTKKSTESRDITGQEIKTKVEEESVKANKTVVGSNQKGEGGQAQQVKPYPNLCGSNQDAATPPADSGKPCSTGSKKPMHWSCALCQVSSTSKRDLDEHLHGKKHKAKEEELLGAQKWTKKSTESIDSAGQEMKTKVEEESVKANKTVVGSDQKGEGGPAQQVKPYPNLCGSKQEAATVPADSGKPCSTGSKKPMHWSCALCQVSSTSKRNLDEHLRGEKHKAKEEELVGAQKWTKKSTESRDIAGQEMKTKVEEKSVKANKTVVGSDQKGEGGLAQQVKLCPNLCGSKQEATTLPADSGKPCSTGSQKPMHWSCALCQVSSTSKRDLDEHLHGKKHKAKEEELLGAQKWTKKSTESIDSAGQEMKTKVEEESVKANKTVVGSDQKGEGGPAQQVKPYPNLCGSKQEAATVPADSGKPCSTGSKKPMHWSCALCQVSSTSKRNLDEHLRGEKHKAKEEELVGAQKWTKKSTESRDIAGQEMKTKVEEKSVKANKTVVGSDQKGEGGLAQQVKLCPNLCGSKQEATTLPADSGKPCSTGSQKPMHWSCALCQVSSTSKRNLDEHLRGKKHKAKEEGLEREKKHMARSNESKKNDEAVSLTTSTTIVTPLEPTQKVEDEDVVAEESNEETVDCVIENAEDEEVVVYRGRQSGPDTANSLLC